MTQITLQLPSSSNAARLAVSLVFLVNGAVLATWVSRIPVIKGALGLSDGQLGLALLGMAVGALIAFPVTGFLTARFGSRNVTLSAGALYCLTLPLLALAPSLPLLTLTLLAFGAFNGSMDVAMNAHGVEVEERSGQRILSSLHGMWSLGGFVGAGLGVLANQQKLSPSIHLMGMAALLAGILVLVAPRLLASKPTRRSGDPVFSFPTPALLGFGIIAFCAFLSEGAMADWSAVYLRDTLKTSASFAAVGYAAFSLTMTAGRFTGDALVTWLGPVRTVRFGGLLAGLGLGAALILGSPVFTLIGFACVGLGMAAIAPLVFSAAGRTTGVSSGTAIAAVATMGYTGFLAGPPLIGLLSQGVTMRVALGVVALLSLIVAMLSGNVRGAALHGEEAPSPKSVP
ncbi:MFS transporter [Deinococcus sp. UYEF24]